MYSLLFNFRYRVSISIKFRFRFFKYPFYSKILVLLVYSYNIFKLLLSLGRYSTWDQFLGFSRYFKFLIDINRYSRSLVDIGGYFILVKFSRIIRLVKSSRFLRYRVDISRNLRLSGFSKFRFKVKVVYYRAFLLVMGGGK